jgi:hypothetical protein
MDDDSSITSPLGDRGETRFTSCKTELNERTRGTSEILFLLQSYKRSETQDLLLSSRKCHHSSNPAPSMLPCLGTRGWS